MGSFELGTDGPGAIVVGVDGSPTSLRAAAYAAGLARRQRTKLIAVYARTSPGTLLALADHSGVAAGAVLQTQDELAEHLQRADQAVGHLGRRRPPGGTPGRSAHRAGRRGEGD